MAVNPNITPDIIRLFLLDRASDNFLLDEQEASDESINLAITLAVDLYNTTDPFVDFRTPEDFPFRAQLILGVTAFLLRMRGINMLRNSVDYQTAGGVTVDEKAVVKEYFILSKEYMQDYKDQIGKIKTQINVGQGYGAQGSPYTIINLGGSINP